MSLSQLQQGLQGVYELDITHDIYDYLITNSDLAACLNSGQSFRNAREKLLVHEDKEGLNLSLYLDQDIVERFSDHAVFNRMDHSAIQDYCLALEGVSHFVYLIWNATYDRSVTLMEMELQAEIDKFVMLSGYLEQQSAVLTPGQLGHLLFQSAVYHDDLSEEERRRYRMANYYAQKYCQQLEKRFLSNTRRDLWLNELRRFYRLNRREKLDYIESTY